MINIHVLYLTDFHGNDIIWIIWRGHFPSRSIEVNRSTTMEIKYIQKIVYNLHHPFGKAYISILSDPSYRFFS